MIRLGRAVTAAILLVFLVPTSASAEQDCHYEGKKLVCEGSGGGQGDGNNDPVYTVPGPWTEYRYVPTCSANAPEGGADALCGAAVMSCPDDGDIRFWVYARTAYPDNREPTDWRRVRTECRGADEVPEDGPPVITEWMIREAAEAAAPETVVHAEPVATSYVSVPNNFYVDSAPTNTTVTLIGIQIPVSYTPTTFTWSFGDGTSGSGAGVRRAAVGAAGAVEHEYRRQGTYGVTATRGFTVVATLPGGETLTIDVPVTSTSDPYELEVGEIQSLVTKVD